MIEEQKTVFRSVKTQANNDFAKISQELFWDITFMYKNRTRARIESGLTEQTGSQSRCGIRARQTNGAVFGIGGIRGEARGAVDTRRHACTFTTMKR